jgi:hypothetical protein
VAVEQAGCALTPRFPSGWVRRDSFTHLYLGARGIDDDNQTERGSCQRQRDPMTTPDCEVTGAQP